jgi:hypothetical protein
LLTSEPLLHSDILDLAFVHAKGSLIALVRCMPHCPNKTASIFLYYPLRRSTMETRSVQSMWGQSPRYVADCIRRHVRNSALESN